MTSNNLAKCAKLPDFYEYSEKPYMLANDGNWIKLTGRAGGEAEADDDIVIDLLVDVFCWTVVVVVVKVDELLLLLEVVTVCPDITLFSCIVSVLIETLLLLLEL